LFPWLVRDKSLCLMNSRLFRHCSRAMILAFVLVSVPFDPSAAQDREASLRLRAEGQYRALTAGDYAEALAYCSPLQRKRGRITKDVIRRRALDMRRYFNDWKVDGVHVMGLVGRVFVSAIPARLDEKVLKQLRLPGKGQVRFKGVDLWRYENKEWVDVEDPLEAQENWLAIQSPDAPPEAEQKARQAEFLRLYREFIHDRLECTRRPVLPVSDLEGNAAPYYVSLSNLYLKERRNVSLSPDSRGVDQVMKGTQYRRCSLFPAYYREWERRGGEIPLRRVFRDYGMALKKRGDRHRKAREVGEAQQSYRALIRFGRHLSEDASVSGLMETGLFLQITGFASIMPIMPKKDIPAYKVRLKLLRRQFKSLGRTQKLLRDLEGYLSLEAQALAALTLHEPDIRKTSMRALATLSTRGAYLHRDGLLIPVLLENIQQQERARQMLHKAAISTGESWSKKYAEFALRTSLEQWVYGPDGSLKP